MARLGVHRPKRVGERYESLAGDLNERRTRYLFRRHLGVEPEDVPNLPWWKRKLYIEGLLWEFSDNKEDTEYIDSTPENLQGEGFSVNTITV